MTPSEVELVLKRLCVIGAPKAAGIPHVLCRFANPNVIHVGVNNQEILNYTHMR